MSLAGTTILSSRFSPLFSVSVTCIVNPLFFSNAVLVEFTVLERHAAISTDGNLPCLACGAGGGT
jgi:hypothetical protein